MLVLLLLRAPASAQDVPTAVVVEATWAGALVEELVALPDDAARRARLAAELAATTDAARATRLAQAVAALAQSPGASPAVLRLLLLHALEGRGDLSTGPRGVGRAIYVDETAEGWGVYRIVDHRRVSARELAAGAAYEPVNSRMGRARMGAYIGSSVFAVAATFGAVATVGSGLASAVEGFRFTESGDALAERYRTDAMVAGIATLGCIGAAVALPVGIHRRQGDVHRFFDVDHARHAVDAYNARLRARHAGLGPPPVEVELWLAGPGVGVSATF